MWWLEVSDIHKMQVHLYGVLSKLRIILLFRISGFVHSHKVFPLSFFILGQSDASVRLQDDISGIIMENPFIVIRPYFTFAEPLVNRCHNSGCAVSMDVASHT